jgi:hypothetical protein
MTNLHVDSPIRQASLEFPSAHETRAVVNDAGELQALFRWVPRDHLRAVRNARCRYRYFCSRALAQIERAAR